MVFRQLEMSDRHGFGRNGRGTVPRRFRHYGVFSRRTWAFAGVKGVWIHSGVWVSFCGYLLHIARRLAYTSTSTVNQRIFSVYSI